MSDGPYIDWLSLFLKVEYVSIANMQKEDSELVMLTLLWGLHVVADSDCDFYTESRSMCSIHFCAICRKVSSRCLVVPYGRTAECSNFSTQSLTHFARTFFDISHRNTNTNKSNDHRQMHVNQAILGLLSWFWMSAFEVDSVSIESINVEMLLTS